MESTQTVSYLESLEKVAVEVIRPVAAEIDQNGTFPRTAMDALSKAGLLYLVTEKFAGIDLHPEAVSNAQMGGVFEELIRKFAELSNETAGEHFTPRDVIKLMVNLLFIEDDEALTKPGVVRSMYDPTAGTGGMLSVADEHLTSHNPDARLVLYGQELNAESYAICKTDMLIKGQDIANIILGNTLSNDGMLEDVEDYFKREVLPHVPDAWIDHEKTKTGYEIPFNRHFYVFKPPRELAEIDAELKGVTDRIVTMIGELSQ